MSPIFVRIHCGSPNVLLPEVFTTHTSVVPDRSLVNSNSLLPGSQPSKRSFAGCSTSGNSVLESTDSIKISYLPFTAGSGKSKAMYFSSKDNDKNTGKKEGPGPGSNSFFISDITSPLAILIKDKSHIFLLIS